MKTEWLATGRGYEIPCTFSIGRENTKACVVAHGFGSSKESPTVQMLLKALPEQGIGVVAFDFPAHGESRVDGEYLRVPNCTADLADVEALARTLAPEPSVLFMDEPLSNLDAKLRVQLRNELKKMQKDFGITTIYVTHDQMEAMTLATKICLIENGVLQQYDAPLDVYAKPNNVFVADFVGNPAINFIDASGAQQSDGTLTLSALDGMQLSFRPKEPLDVAAWYERADAEDKARRDAENARALDKKSVEKGNKDVLFRYHVARVNETEDFGDEAALTDGDFVLGVRPEFLRLSDSGAIEGEIYSAMPTGMETTVKVRVGSFLLTGVVFGGVLYRIGQKIRLDFQGDGVVLFSRRNGRMIAQGSLSVK